MTVSGIVLGLDAEWATPTLRAAIYDGRYESVEHDILEKTLRPDDRYLEIGGGIGFLATAACRRIGAENVLVFEANPALIAAIEETGRRNGFVLHPVNAVLGDGEGHADFYVHRDFWDSSLVPIQGIGPIRVARVSLREQIARHRATYLMVDIEGGEIELLAEPQSIPDHVRAICLEVHPDVTGNDAVRRLLVELMNEDFALDATLSRNSVLFLSR